MELKEYIDKMKAIENGLLTFLQKMDNFQDNYLNFDHLFEHHNIRDDPFELETVLFILSKITDNHHRMPDFFIKIEHILHIFKDEIKKNFSNFRIFTIFKSNKKILLFLIEEQVLKIDKRIAQILLSDEFKSQNYHYYFFKEIRPFINSNLEEEISRRVPQDFEQKRKEENFICTLIINDSIEEFINYFKENEFMLNVPIDLSLFETHSFLINKKPTLIEYAAFCGSYQIFSYLYQKHAEMKPSVWIYAIHGRNFDIIHLIEQCKIKVNDESYEEILVESIKCHHVDITNYILDNYFKQKNQPELVLCQSLKYYNFNFIQDDLINKSLFYNLCEFGYYKFVKFLLKTTNIDINARSISFFVYFNSIQKKIIFFKWS